jgi:hypothetical protein
MRFYDQSHQYYCGVDLHARSMAFLDAVRAFSPGTGRRRRLECRCAAQRACLASSRTWPDNPAQ